MLLNIIVNIILATNLFYYIINLYKNDYVYNLNAPIILILICISISLYMISSLNYLKPIRTRMLLVNTIYILLASIIYPNIVILLGPVLVEYILLKKYSMLAILIPLSIALLFEVKMKIGYSMISLGIMASIFIYMSTTYRNKCSKLEKVNYELREKIYNIEESRKLEKKLNYQNIEATKIEERNNISQKLHDKIGHVLAGSIMQIEALKIIMNSDKEKSIQILDRITTNLRNGMDDIRYTLRKIKPEQSEMGIKNLKLLLEKFSKEYNINFNISLEGDIEEINLVYWRIILDSINEILTNTIKHSNGDKLNIEISVLNKIIRIYIKDNGTYSGEIKKGMGLLGIEERIVNVGGDVSFDNEDGFSTLIILKR